MVYAKHTRSKLVNTVYKVNNNSLCSQCFDTLHKGLMRRILVDIVIPVFSRTKFRNETMGDAILSLSTTVSPKKNWPYLSTLGGVVLPPLQRRNVRRVGGRVHASLLELEEPRASLKSISKPSIYSRCHCRIICTYRFHIFWLRVGLELDQDSVGDAHRGGECDEKLSKIRSNL